MYSLCSIHKMNFRYFYEKVEAIPIVSIKIHILNEKNEIVTAEKIGDDMIGVTVEKKPESVIEEVQSGKADEKNLDEIESEFEKEEKESKSKVKSEKEDKPKDRLYVMRLGKLSKGALEE